jgi:hypothetical protein
MKSRATQKVPITLWDDSRLTAVRRQDRVAAPLSPCIGQEQRGPCATRSCRQAAVAVLALIQDTGSAGRVVVIDEGQPARALTP